MLKHSHGSGTDRERFRLENEQQHSCAQSALGQETTKTPANLSKLQSAQEQLFEWKYPQSLTETTLLQEFQDTNPS